MISGYRNTVSKYLHDNWSIEKPLYFSVQRPMVPQGGGVVVGFDLSSFNNREVGSTLVGGFLICEINIYTKSNTNDELTVFDYVLSLIKNAKFSGLDKREIITDNIDTDDSLKRLRVSVYYYITI